MARLCHQSSPANSPALAGRAGLPRRIPGGAWVWPLERQAALALPHVRAERPASDGPHPPPFALLAHLDRIGVAVPPASGRPTRELAGVVCRQSQTHHPSSDGGSLVEGISTDPLVR